jgi:PAS domain S-box-containing protein
MAPPPDDDRTAEIDALRARVAALEVELDRHRGSESREEAYRVLLDEPSSPIFSFDPDGRYRCVNRAFAEGVGRTAADIIGRTIWDVFPKPAADARFAAVREVFATGVERTIEVTVSPPEGEPHTYVTTVRPSRDADGRVVTVVCTSEDITPRRRAEALLRESEEKFSAAFRAVPIAIFLARLEDDVLLEVNEAFAALVGVDAASCVGRRLGDVGLRVEETTGAALDEAVRARRPVTGKRCEIATTAGTIVGIVNAHTIRLRGADCVLGSIADVTELERREAARLELVAEVAQAEKMETVGRLAGGVAHDFNNMLGVILGNTELALASLPDDTPVRPDLEEVRDAALRSANLTRQLLAFARKQPAVPRTIDLDASVGELVKMLRRLLGEDLALEIRTTAGLWPVRIDPGQLDQILVNLCINARDAIRGVGTVVVATENRVVRADPGGRGRLDHPDGDYVVLSVRDDGCGMDEATRARSFEPYFTTKRLGEGTGLGLATVDGIVRQNGGFVRVESTLGEGSTFEVHLPRALGGATRGASDGPAPASKGGGETILLVEDEPGMLRAVRVALERAGYAVLAAASPSEAERLAGAWTGAIDLLVSDVVMPEMDGIALADRLAEARPGLKRLFISGYTADVLAQRGAGGESVDLLFKPFTGSELSARVRAALDAPRAN